MYLPSRRQFRLFSRRGKAVPVAMALPLESSAQDLFEALAFRPPHMLLESARTHPVTGRYSILVGQPQASLIAKGTEQGNPLSQLQKMLDARQAVRIPGFPPFVGGAVGFLGFDCFQYLEPMPLRACNDLNLPDIGFFFFDEAIVLDHIEQRIWAIALAYPKGDPDAAYHQAVGRVEALLERLTLRRPYPGQKSVFVPDTVQAKVPFESTHTRAEFEAMVRSAKEFIAQGEIYQANLSQRFKLPLTEEPWAMYRRLTSINPSPFAAYADLGRFQVVSASPERFLRVEGQRVETRPIAGTSPKGETADGTRQMRQALLLSPKERAEHLMLVDLERNDLGRVCRYGSVGVDELMELEEYSHVIHIVSNVSGVLRPGTDPVDLIAATFPGGTITGCPKIRSIEVIDALEPVRRQLYTGSFGWISATGDLDLNLLIRTAFVVGESVYIQAGAGIVADSDPSREYEETLHKAQALMDLMQTDVGSQQLVPVSS